MLRSRALPTAFAPTSPQGRRGFTLVEAVIALAMLALVVSAFGALQLSNLRSTRRSAEVRAAAALLSSESALQRLLPTSAGACRVAAWSPAGWTCRVDGGCASPSGCAIERFEVEVSLPDGRTFTTTGFAHRVLEAAAFRPMSSTGAEP